MSKAEKALDRLQRLVGVSGLIALAAIAVLVGGTADPAVAAGCPNEAIRAEQGERGLALPDCRAYEMVSPNGSSPASPGNGGYLAAVSGERFSYKSWNPYTGSNNESLSYVSIRGAGGWSPFNPIPGQNGAKTSINFACNPSFIGSPELDHLLLIDGYREEDAAKAEAGEECLGDEPPAVPGEARGTANLFRTDPQGSSYTLLNPPPPGVEGQNAGVQVYNHDMSSVVFGEPAQLTADAPAPVSGNVEEDLYIWHEGTVRYLAYLPDGTPVLALLANGGENTNGSHNDIATPTHAMSEDGERVVFEHESKIYLREHALREPSAVSGGVCTEPAKACTFPIDVSEEGPSEYDSFGTRRRTARHFQYATPDGSRIFFTDCRKLTPDSTAVGPSKNEYSELVNEKPDLYEYNVATREVRDLTVNASEPANVRGFSGASEDGNYIYFAAYGDLTGAEQNSNGDTAIANRANLYLWHAGTITYVATLEGGAETATGGESSTWQEGSTSGTTQSGRTMNTGGLAARYSANGKYLLFESAENLTGFDSLPPEPSDCRQEFGSVRTGSELRCKEVYLYDAETATLACASCSPTGEAPTGDTNVTFLIKASENYSSSYYLPRDVSETGTVFFTTPNALVPQDTNGADDVYEYENGRQYLISSGAAGDTSTLYDAGADGNNVFFNAGLSLVGRDGDGANSLYDARVGGGFAEPPPLPGCEGEACRGPSTAKSAEPAAGTAGFSGPGNKVARHKRDCSTVSVRAKKLSKRAKKLRRRARKARGPHRVRLRHKTSKVAKKARKVSKQAKTCRRSNRRGK